MSIIFSPFSKIVNTIYNYYSPPPPISEPIIVESPVVNLTDSVVINESHKSMPRCILYEIKNGKELKKTVRNNKETYTLLTQIKEQKEKLSHVETKINSYQDTSPLMQLLQNQLYQRRYVIDDSHELSDHEFSI